MTDRLIYWNVPIHGLRFVGNAENGRHCAYYVAEAPRSVHLGMRDEMMSVDPDDLLGRWVLGKIGWNDAAAQGKGPRIATKLTIQAMAEYDVNHPHRMRMDNILKLAPYRAGEPVYYVLNGRGVHLVTSNLDEAQNRAFEISYARIWNASFCRWITVE